MAVGGAFRRGASPCRPLFRTRSPAASPTWAATSSARPPSGQGS